MLLITSGLLLSSLSIADVTEGKKIYDNNCAACHGKNLEGGIGSNFIDGIWNYGNMPQLIALNVKFGIVNLEMPAWENKLTDAEIQSVVDYVLDKEKHSKVKPPPIPNIIKTELYDLNVDVLNSSLDTPWAIDFIDANNALVTDRAGKLYRMANGVIQKDPVKSIPSDVAQAGQAGLFDVVVDPNFEKNGWIYLSYAQSHDPSVNPQKAKTMTRIVRGQIKDNRWTNEQVLYQADGKFYTTSRAHFGARIAVDQNYLYFSVGDRGAKEQAQDLTRPNGKIHRINKDGSIPTDNPFLNVSGANPTIYSYGHRNPQGLTMNRITGQVWSTEHGPMGGDELNLVNMGKNYGWPEITYGRNYDGTAITDFTEKPGMEQPVIHWTPSIAVFSLDFYRGDLFSKWRNNILVSSLKYRELKRLTLDGDKVTSQETLVKGIGRMRSVKTSPDGAIYVLFNDPALILRFTPANQASARDQ